MKARFFLFSCLGALLLSACSSNKGPGSPDLAEGTTIEMAVPVGCQTVRIDYPTAMGIRSVTAGITTEASVLPGHSVSPIANVSLNIVSPVATRVNIYDEAGNLLVGNVAIAASTDLDTKVMVASVKLPEEAVNEYITADGPFTFYHSSGVVMFDDSWPFKTDTVDADFSDAVIDYDIEAKIVDADAAPNDTWRECVKVVMHLRTVGGMFPDKAGVVLEGLDTRFIDNYDVRLTLGNWNENIPAGSLTSTVDISGAHPVIMLNNLAWLNSSAAATATYVNSKTGATQGFVSGPGIYYNVSPGKINTGGDLFTLTVVFRGKDRSTISEAEGSAQVANFINAVMDTESQNFFLRTDVTMFGYGRYEIHLKGYQPTSFFAASYPSVSAMGIAKDNSTTYCSSVGYVWGFKTPVMTRHAWEGTSFYEAYPEYKGWALSRGVNNREWYKHPVADKVVTWW